MSKGHHKNKPRFARRGQRTLDLATTVEEYRPPGQRKITRTMNRLLHQTQPIARPARTEAPKEGD